MPRFRRPAHVVSSNQWHLRARLSTLHPSDRPASSGLLAVPRATSTARATRERRTNHQPAWRADRRSLLFEVARTFALTNRFARDNPSRVASMGVPDLRNDPRWHVAHVTDAVLSPDTLVLEVESSKAMRLGPKKQIGIAPAKGRFLPAPRRLWLLVPRPALPGTWMSDGEPTLPSG